ncbi:hypothetical protein F5Y19DRAFT_49574 [Xylariaceae sp. FL1651]|nr:hypothetical protein F5Y19DRAFT_49574 [Xylariaceae sp. FL1651]
MEYENYFSTLNTPWASSLGEVRTKSPSHLALDPEEEERIDTIRSTKPGLREDPHALFKECVPTKERLEALRMKWLNADLLGRRLLFCQPFTMAYEEPETSVRSIVKQLTFWPREQEERQSTRLVMKSQHALAELLQEGKLGSFASQLSNSWPGTFGLLIDQGRQPPHFQWNLGEPHLGDGTVFLCLKCVADGSQQALEALSHMVEVCLNPSDNMLW